MSSLVSRLSAIKPLIFLFLEALVGMDLMANSYTLFSVMAKYERQTTKLQISRNNMAALSPPLPESHVTLNVPSASKCAGSHNEPIGLSNFFLLSGLDETKHHSC